MHLSRAFIDDLLVFLRSRPAKTAIAREKVMLAKKHALGTIPSDIQILTHLAPADFSFAKELLQTKPVRTGSGVCVVAVMTKPMRCPHGRCTYCPGGPGSVYGDVPQSYTGHEPATMRGMRAGWDAYVQVFSRLEQYVVLGHNPEKVELIIMGGTFPSYPLEYQDEVIADLFSAMNDFGALFFSDGEFLFERFKEFFLLPGSVHDMVRSARVKERILEQKSRRAERSIAQLQEENERAMIRCVGLTIETRPSHARREHALRMLSQGCTRVELGVQTVFDDVLALVHRDHTVADTAAAIADLRDLGFKLNFHVMLGLPGMDEARDEEAFSLLFSDERFRPDMLKIYPCMVMPGTPLYADWKAGTYVPYTTTQAAKLLARLTPLLPLYCRVMRVQRDIPTKVTSAGVDRTNLHQLVDDERRLLGVVSADIRSREVRSRAIGEWSVRVSSYDAAHGSEYFIEAVETASDALIGFCRLRIPSRTLHPALDDAAIVRELHVYGTAAGVDERLSGKAQHRGIGKALLARAEEIARQSGSRRVAVISGVGVREYYKKLGYARVGPYVAKELAPKSL